MYSRLKLNITVAIAAALLLQLPLAVSAQTADQTAAAPVAKPAKVQAPVVGSAAAPASGTTSTTGSLRGRAVDPTNAVIPGANIVLTGADGKTYTTQSTGDGTYLIPNVAPGTYTVSTQISGFTSYTKANIKISAGVMARQNLHLNLEVNTIVNVKTDDATALSVNPDSNASTVVLTGQALDALSDDPDELSDELSALAGPAAGPNGGQIYIDGFTGGELPPKNTIREIRINQNPFSAEYDKVGYGRIEIFTKPGTDKLHGSVNIQGNDDAFNTSAITGGIYQPPYHTLFFQGSLTGPLTKTASYNIGGTYRDIQDDNIVNTTIAPASNGYVPTTFFQSVFYPQTRIDLSPRLDLQIAPNNTLTARYQFDHNKATNGGTGASSLATAGYDSTSHNNQIQLSDSQTLGAKIVTETRFEYTDAYTSTAALNPQFANKVQGAFTDFGNGTGISTDSATHLEVQSYTSVALKNNFIRFGGRFRYDGDTNSSTSGYYGSFTYAQNQVPINATTTAYLTDTNYSDCLNPANGVYYVIGICNYSVVQQQGAANAVANGFGPVQYNVTAGAIPQGSNFPVAGIPSISASVMDLGLYAEDDWKIAPNFTLSYGLRYETQNHITDHHDFAPRLSAAWGLGGKNGGAPSFVVRGGFGIFYDRFGIGQIENVARMNGVNEVAYTVLTPSIACVASPVTNSTTNTCGITTSRAINYIQAPNLRSPYTIQGSGSVEHNLFKQLTLTFTYLYSRGEHQLFQQNTAFNAVPTTTNTYEYVSEGIFKQNQYIIQANYRGPANTSLFGYYVYGRAKGDVSGTGSIAFPSDSSPNNIAADYGRASFDVRHRVFFGGSASFPHYITVSPFMIANSGTPFNITLGQDLNGDTIFNDRPAFCSGSTLLANAYNTRYGCFDRGTLLSQARIPINYGEGPAQFTLNLRVTKTWGFGAYTHGQNGGRHRNGGGGGGMGQPPVGGGPGGGGGGGRGGGGGGGMGGGGGSSTGRRYNFTIGAQALNLFNVVNYATPQGVLSSPQFGQQTQLAGGIYSTNTAVRRVTLQASFSF